MSFFDGNPFGETIFHKRYAHHGETWQDAQFRQASFVGAGENAETIAKFYNSLYEGRIAGGGRIAYAAGRPVPQMINCFVLPTGDSREAWGTSLHDTTVVSGTGGGIGKNFSSIRYRGAVINGTGGTSSGSVSLMKMLNAIGREIKGGGGRRVAYMFNLNHDHPDTPEFIRSKEKTQQIPQHVLDAFLGAGGDIDLLQQEHPELFLGDLDCANISVNFMNESPAAFFDKVNRGEDHEFVWNGEVVARMPAHELWDLMVDKMLSNGEPGMLNGHLANKMNTIYYCRDLVSTNPCGEIWMQPYSVCCLGAVVLPRFVNMDNDNGSQIDWEGMRKAVHTLVRFLDDVLDTTHYPIPQVAEESRLTRRIGAGYMGLHDMLLMLGYKYSSAQGRQFAAHVAEFIRDEAYIASIELAREKGAFPLFNAEHFLASGFARTLPEYIRDGIQKYGIRNCALLTIAPYGTTAIVQGVTSGCEAIMGCAWDRKYYDGPNIATETVVHPLFEKFVTKGWPTLHFEASEEIAPENHLKMQMTLQRFIDNSISKTINIPQATYSRETLSRLLMTFAPFLKGTTIYPVGSRANTPIVPRTRDEALEIVKSRNYHTEVHDDCKSGVCAI